MRGKEKKEGGAPRLWLFGISRSRRRSDSAGMVLRLNFCAQDRRADAHNRLSLLRSVTLYVSWEILARNREVEGPRGAMMWFGGMG